MLIQAPVRPAQKASLEDWTSLGEDDSRELVDGVLTETEMPDVLHEVLVVWLIGLFKAWAPSKSVVLGSGVRYALSPTRGRLPDVSVFLAGRKPPLRGAVTIPPDIAVEVISSSRNDARRDRVEKLAEYATFGIQSYWLVDPQARTLEILQLGDDGLYRHVAGAADGRLDHLPGLDGLVIDVDALWAAADELTDDD